MSESKKVIGYIIEGDKGFFLNKENLWSKEDLSVAHIHDPNQIEKIREAFHRSRNKPTRMYEVERQENATTLIANPISFYASITTSKNTNPKYFGDCIQLTT